ncbi:hypothetical protein B0H16DRAFT_155636 [Mycena metata]|uniref:Uncharacterized protein n=1 Tax=Mycena metata TaxID=1033252 RepID=A0AAD7MV54_9AGAR|nr:hypothetical protein B0H16DRAFT_155636 [Mycena metata]
MSAQSGDVPTASSSVRAVSVRETATAYLDTLQRGFEILSVAAGIVIAIQAQILGTTIGISRNEETVSLGAVNVLFLGGLILDIMSASLAFLTSRWLQRLTIDEREFLEKTFASSESHDGHRTSDSPQLPPPKSVLDSKMAISFFARSLFVPFPLLLAGAACLVLGLLVYIWAQQALGVAVIVTVIYIFTLPFFFAVFLIGRDQQRRKEIIMRLSMSQGDW